MPMGCRVSPSPPLRPLGDEYRGNGYEDDTNEDDDNDLASFFILFQDMSKGRLVACVAVRISGLPSVDVCNPSICVAVASWQQQAVIVTMVTAFLALLLLMLVNDTERDKMKNEMLLPS